MRTKHIVVTLLGLLRQATQRAAEPNYLDVVIRYSHGVPVGFKKSVLTEEELDGSEMFQWPLSSEPARAVQCAIR
jgi:hypothetical protein